MKSGGVFDSEAVKKRIAEKEAIAGQEGFWNDPKNAEKLLSEIKKLKNRIEPWETLIADIEDLQALYELTQEAGEEDNADSIQESIRRSQTFKNGLKSSIRWHSFPMRSTEMTLS